MGQKECSCGLVGTECAANQKIMELVETKPQRKKNVLLSHHGQKITYIYISRVFLFHVLTSHLSLLFKQMSFQLHILIKYGFWGYFFFFLILWRAYKEKDLDKSITKPSPSRNPDTSGTENHQSFAYVNWQKSVDLDKHYFTSKLACARTELNLAFPGWYWPVSFSLLSFHTTCGDLLFPKTATILSNLTRLRQEGSEVSRVDREILTAFIFCNLTLFQDQRSEAFWTRRK